jgi:hypothetical protein
MRLVLIAAMLFALLAVLPRGETPAQPPRGPDPLVDKVKKAIANGVNYLQLQARNRGDWEISQAALAHNGAWTSMALLALLNSGVDPNDESIQKGLASLRKIGPSNHTYESALQIMAYAQAGFAQDLGNIRANVEWLLKARQPTGWSYGGGGPTDNSNTQYALLGLHEAIRAGVPVDKKVLEEIRKFYLGTQQGDGGWRYKQGSPVSMTMTTAGACGLLITGMDLADRKQVLRPDGSAANCGEYTDTKPLADAMSWIGGFFPARINGPLDIGSPQAPYYCLYGIERTGRLSGQRFFDGHDWYRIGCEYLVRIQRGDGSWNTGEQLDGQHPIVATSFALLFLSKGRTPVLMTKFAHGPGAGWNNKHYDVRNVVEFASRELFKKQPLAWQIYDVRTKRTNDEAGLRQELVEDLLSCPLVYLNGHFLRLGDREKYVLREYLGNGGFLFAEACCGDQRFDADFRKLMTELFKEDGVELRPVPKGHPVWTASGRFVTNPDEYPLLGIQQGCKWIVLYSPKPVSGYWEEDLHSEGPGQKAFGLAANVIAYATGLSIPPPRLTETRVLKDDITTSKPKRGYLEIGQLAYEGDWHPAPRAMRTLMTEMRRIGYDVVLGTSRVSLDRRVDLDSDPKLPPIRGPLDLYLFYLHGRSRFEWNAQVMKDLRFKLENGGLLLADACCGSQSFDASFRQFMKQMWADQKLELVQIDPDPKKEELFSQQLNGVEINTVKCRRPGPDGQRPTPEFASLPPLLYGIKYNGRWVVIYSPYDLGCALEKHQGSDCLGHDHDSALLLARAAILYALNR